MKGCNCPALRYASDGASNTSEPSALSYLDRIAQTVLTFTHKWDICLIISELCKIVNACNSSF